MRPSPTASHQMGLIASSDSAVRSALTSAALEPVPVVEAASTLLRHGGSIPILLNLPAEEHRRRRRAIAPAFTRGALQPWSQSVETLSGELMRHVPRGAPISLKATYSLPLALGTACQFVGVSPELEGEVERRVETFFGQGSTPPQSASLAGLRLVRLVVDAFRKAEPEPRREGLRSSSTALCRLEPDIREDAIAAAVSVLMAGTEMTSRAILACVAQQVPLGVGDAEASPTELSDEHIDMAILQSQLLPAVLRQSVAPERDSEVVTVKLQPDDLATGGYPFGLGVHHCLGAHWVRLVSRVATQAFLRSAGAFELVDVFYEREAVGIGGISDISCIVRGGL